LELSAIRLSPAPDACLAVTFEMPLLDDGFEALLEPFYNGKKLTDPITTVDDKFQLLPAFLKVKGTSRRLQSSRLANINRQQALSSSKQPTRHGVDYSRAMTERIQAH
jgi:hypothetical protein